MKEIGGYFELELNHGKEYHFDAIKLNLGRTAFEYVLRAKKVHRVFLPYYTCDVMLEPAMKTGVTHEFYHIDKNLEPIFNYASLNDSDYFLYTNYFGLKDQFIKQLANRVRNLIVDNSQAFFSKPIPGIDTFYSPRKFFGVPDGGYLYTDKTLDENLEIDDSSDRFGHLIGRIEKCAEEYYQIFKENDQRLRYQPIKKMSKITQSLLGNIDYKKTKARRNKNFMFLHDNLYHKNELQINTLELNTPMVYPFLCANGNTLKLKLIENQIFIPTYWPNVLDWCDKNSIEFELTSKLLHLPIDQRLRIKDLKRILTMVKR